MDTHPITHATVVPEMQVTETRAQGDEEAARLGRRAAKRGSLPYVTGAAVSTRGRPGGVPGTA